MDTWAFLSPRPGEGNTGQSAQRKREDCKLLWFLLLLLLLLLLQYLNKYVSALFCPRMNGLGFFSPPKPGRIVCPAREVATNKTAPPPMTPKLLTVREGQYFYKFKGDNILPPGQSFLQVENCLNLRKSLQSVILGSSCLIQPGPSPEEPHVANAVALS